MRLFSEIAKSLAREGLDASRVQYTVLDGRGGYLQNVKRLVEFSDTRLIVRGRRGGVLFEGQDFRLGKYFAGDLVVHGNIARTQRID